jgi:hypothetical protein
MSAVQKVVCSVSSVLVGLLLILPPGYDRVGGSGVMHSPFGGPEVYIDAPVELRGPEHDYFVVHDEIAWGLFLAELAVIALVTAVIYAVAGRRSTKTAT